MSDSKQSKSKKTDAPSHKKYNFFIYIIFSVIILAFLVVGGVKEGVTQFVSDIGKEITENENGTISIESEAQTRANGNKQGTYVGKVLNEKIQIGNKDLFNNQLAFLMSYKGLNAFQQYQMANNYFREAINKIIAMHNARKMNLHVSEATLVKEVGKRYYNKDGEIDYVAMDKDLAGVNQQAKEVMQDLLYENYVYDYFKGLPVAKPEIDYNYKLKNVKINLQYIDIKNDEISDKKLEDFYKINSVNYKMYKITKLIFKDKAAADEALKRIQAEPAKFIEIGTELKDEEKVLNIKYESDYRFIEDFENAEIKAVVKSTKTGNVAKRVATITDGPVIIRVEDTITGAFFDDKVKSKVKEDYIAANLELIKEENKKKAEQVYNTLIESDFDKVKSEFKLESKNADAITFLDRNIPNLNSDVTDDLNYIVNVFKAGKDDILKPHQYENGFMIVKVVDKIDVEAEKIDELGDSLNKQFSDEKKNELETDFYREEWKRYRVVDNSGYVFRELFFSNFAAEENLQ